MDTTRMLSFQSFSYSKGVGTPVPIAILARLEMMRMTNMLTNVSKASVPGTLMGKVFLHLPVKQIKF